MIGGQKKSDEVAWQKNKENDEGEKESGTDMHGGETENKERCGRRESVREAGREGRKQKWGESDTHLTSQVSSGSPLLYI